ncbi:DUF2059 domain-containing protein [Bradyrhizobium sp. STM 3809]|uniref:DUF2059 domain-containing protein n=1 Tax=Bradyrhizobium sp. STM 3809 TaxID=551936 RepID=UPI00024081A6|nr:DUF2059 domain-containing protein [Bradyrhizobium sp. STM 3809]CCE02930.1 conserved exported hypothetical protein [Bradyrhizobium sp. STM 3809]
MKSVFRILPAAGLVLAVAAASPAAVQAQGQPPALKPASAACMAGAKEILAMKNASALYANAVPGIVQQAKQTLLQSNLNYQKDLDEVAVVVAQTYAGKEKEIGDKMAQIYCNEFTDAEIANLVAFYKTPLGQKLINAEPKAIQMSMMATNQWAAEFSETVTAQFRAEMRKRNKPI